VIAKGFQSGQTHNPSDIVVFAEAAADGPAAAIAATVSERARAGATHVAVNATDSDADLERFVRFLAQEVNPRLE
jgi:hypothetical protein